MERVYNIIIESVYFQNIDEKLSVDKDYKYMYVNTTLNNIEHSCRYLFVIEI